MVGDNSHYFDTFTGMMITSCAEKSMYETLYLWIDDYRFEISVDDYWLQYNNDIPGYEASEDTCLIAIVDDPRWYQTYWHFGTKFMEGYYTILDNSDHANAKIGFAPHATSSKVNIEKLTKPTKVVDDVLWETTWVA